jgi:hypothetical protein
MSLAVFHQGLKMRIATVIGFQNWGQHRHNSNNNDSNNNNKTTTAITAVATAIVCHNVCNS